MGYGPSPSGVRTFDRRIVPSRIGVGTSFCLVTVHSGFSAGAVCWAPPRCTSPTLARSDRARAAATGKRYRPMERREVDDVSPTHGFIFTIDFVESPAATAGTSAAPVMTAAASTATPPSATRRRD